MRESVGQGHINADYSESVVMRTTAMDWQESPSPKVWRKRLDLSGPREQGRVTSIVRYDRSSKFPPHPHPDGEEILVLDGVFSDQSGDYSAGTFLLNPEGFEHAPFSKEGCILFVKLRQYPGGNRTQVNINLLDAPWQDNGKGQSSLVLYNEQNHPERIEMMRLEPGSALTIQSGAGGAELFLLSGSLENSGERFATGDWLRWPTQEDRVFTAIDTVTVYVKTGHLPV